MEKDLISIIIPVYNCEKYIEKCIKSVINQTYKNIEILCINDGSTDESLKVLKKLELEDKRIIVIDKINEGVSVARNTGLDTAKGKYISFIDSDDWIDENFIEILYKTLIKKQVDVVRCNNYITTDKNEKIYNLENSSNTYIDNKNISQILSNIINCKLNCYVMLLLIKKEKIVNVRFNNRIHMMEDTLFYIDMLNYIENMYIFDKPLYHYFQNIDGACRNKKHLERNIKEILMVNKLIKDKLENNNNFTSQLENMLNEYTLNWCLSNIMLMYKYKIDINSTNKAIAKLMKNEYAKNIYSNIKFENLKLHLKIPIKLLFNNNLILLKIYYKLILNLYKLKIS